MRMQLRESKVAYEAARLPGQSEAEQPGDASFCVETQDAISASAFKYDESSSLTPGIWGMFMPGKGMKRETQAGQIKSRSQQGFARRWLH